MFEEGLSLEKSLLNKREQLLQHCLLSRQVEQGLQQQEMLLNIDKVVTKLYPPSAPEIYAAMRIRTMLLYFNINVS